MKWLRPSVLVSPVVLLVLAALIAAGYKACDLAGWRPYVSILSGTLPADSSHMTLRMFQGVLYGAAYFGTVLVAPVFVIAAILQLTVLRWLRPGGGLAASKPLEPPPPMA